MSVERTSLERVDVNRGANSWDEDEEIDLRKYIDALIRWWREIIVITLATILLVIVAVEGLRFLLTPRYEAEASVAIVRTFSDVSLDPRFKTQTEDTTTTQANSASARRSALLGLASSSSIAQKVIDQLGDKLSDNERIAANLAEQVTAEQGAGSRSGGESDLINLTAISDSPEKATVIANTWAQIYVQTVNAIYGQVPDDLLTSIESEQSTAQKSYDKSQTDLETFVANNHIDTLNRQITETQSIIDNLQRGKAAALTQLVNNIVAARSQVMKDYLTAQAESQVVAYKKEQEGRQALITTYLDAINNAQADVFQQQSDQDAKLLRSYYNTWQQSVQALSDANVLKAQVEKGGQGAVRSSGLALQLLKLQVFTQIFNNDTQPLHPNKIEDEKTPQQLDQPIVDANNVRLQLQIGDNTPTLTQEEMLGDLNSLISVLDSRRTDLESKIATLSDKLLAGSNYSALGKTIPLDSKLVQSVQAQYQQLSQPSWSSPLTATLAALAATTVSPTLGQALPAGQTLDQLGEQWARELLQLKGLANLPTNKDVDGSVAQTISQLETQNLALKAQLEAERSRQLRLTHERDLNWDTLKTLSSKVAELNLARAANSSEVRLAASAVPPVDPLKRLSLTLAVAAAGVVGLFLGIIITLFGEYLGKEPFLGRRPTAPKATAGA
ncbi:MAG: Wzz/FepE/Etk N-terminal domain-containing protein [Chloroflexi bacterium]|nr:Wzz/FepE/Etk N-terminal domain-containing protein [Chloroflexota bacterium]